MVVRFVTKTHICLIVSLSHAPPLPFCICTHEKGFDFRHRLFAYKIIVSNLNLTMLNALIHDKYRYAKKPIYLPFLFVLYNNYTCYNSFVSHLLRPDLSTITASFRGFYLCIFTYLLHYVLLFFLRTNNDHIYHVIYIFIKYNLYIFVNLDDI